LFLVIWKYWCKDLSRWSILFAYFDRKAVEYDVLVSCTFTAFERLSVSICSEQMTKGSFANWQTVSCLVMVLLAIDLFKHFWTILIKSFSSPVSDSQL